MRRILWWGSLCVNTWAWLLLVVAGCGYHLGRPPAPEGGFGVAQVSAPVAEPGAADALRSGLMDALSRRGALDPSAGTGHEQQVEARILALTELPVAVGSDARVHRIALSVEIEVAATRQKTIVQGERAFLVSPEDPLGASAARAEAVASLAQELSVDAVEWLLRAPAVREVGR